VIEQLGDPLKTAKQPRRGLLPRNVCIKGVRTSVRLDEETWRLLREVAELRGLTVHQLCDRIETVRDPALTVSAAIRKYLVAFFRQRWIEML
jgi:predicted DNA-binding ribbon-helix-helix protein